MTITTGLTSLDHLTAGLEPGTVTIYAGVSQSGMSTLLDTTVRAAALHADETTLVVDLESARPRGLRILAGYAGVDLLALQRDKLTADQAVRVEMAKQASASAPLHFSASRTLGALRADIRKVHPALLAVDGVRYFEVADPEDQSSNALSVAALKTLAQEFGLAVVATASLNRDHIGARGPRLENLGKGVLAFSDAVVLLDREGVPGDHSDCDDVTLTVAKTRHNSQPASCTVMADFSHARLLDSTGMTGLAA